MAWSCAGSQQAQGRVSQVGLGVKPQPLAVEQVAINIQNIFYSTLFLDDTQSNTVLLNSFFPLINLPVLYGSI